MHTVLLIDADIIAYQQASAGQQEWSFGTALDSFEDVLARSVAAVEALLDRLHAHDAILCFSCPSSEGWRRGVYPSYKANRAGTSPPVHRESLKRGLGALYRSFFRPTLEGDDIMGILSTHPKMIPGKKIIVSIDKDMKTIPGWLFNPAKDRKPVFISEEEADYSHLFQTLTGDTTDGYPGCPGVGPKKAEVLLRDSPTPWDSVVSAFVQRGLTEEDALVQARVARICRFNDYDFKRKEVILWTPS